MLITNQQLLTLPVVTESQKMLGKVSHFDIDAETSNIRNIYVKNKGIKGLFENELKIHRGQIVEINDKKIVVMDNVALSEQAVSSAVKPGAELRAAGSS